MTGLATLALRVEPFTSAHVTAVRAFNQRLAAAGASWRCPEDPPSEWLPREPESGVFQELFLALEGDQVRGGYGMKRQPMLLGGERRQVGNIYLPLSEGTINRAYSQVAARLFSDAMEREPLIYTLGLGGAKTTVTRLVRALGWELYPVPFFFRVVDGARFLRQLRYLRTSRFRSRLMDLAAFSGLGWAIAAGAGALLTRRPPTSGSIEADEVDKFGEWADELWRSCATSYSFATVRTSAVLNRIYPQTRKDLLRLRISQAGQVIGYAVLQDQHSQPSEPLGEMRVGTVIDALARPEHAELVMWRAERTLEARKVDLMISNQSHPAWAAALRRVGFIEGPSNYLFAATKPLADQIRAVDSKFRNVHLNRGDGECY